jgi:hypothetical protein
MFKRQLAKHTQRHPKGLLDGRSLEIGKHR